MMGSSSNGCHPLEISEISAVEETPSLNLKLLIINWLINGWKLKYCRFLSLALALVVSRLVLVDCAYLCELMTTICLNHTRRQWAIFQWISSCLCYEMLGTADEVALLSRLTSM